MRGGENEGKKEAEDDYKEKEEAKPIFVNVVKLFLKVQHRRYFRIFTVLGQGDAPLSS